MDVTPYVLTMTGQLGERDITAAAADDIVAGAVAWRSDIAVDDNGVITIREEMRTTVLEPYVKPRRITQGGYEDLTLIGVKVERGEPVILERDPRHGTLHIAAGFWSVSASFTEVLIRHGWISVLAVREGLPVTVSVGGRIARAWHETRLHLDAAEALRAAAVAGLEAHPTF